MLRVLQAPTVPAWFLSNRAHFERPLVGAAGALLIVAGTLKIADVAPSSDGFRNTSLALVAALELALALWLLSGRWRNAALAATALLFALFAGVAGHNVLNGGTSCGCFGTWNAPPLAMFVVDLLVVAGAITVLSKKLGGPGQLRVSTGGMLCTAFAVVLAGWALAWSSPTLQPLQFSAIDLGALPADIASVREIQLVNTSGQPLEVATAGSSCRCARFELSPQRLSPAERFIARAIVTPSGSARLRIELIAYDSQGQPVFSVPLRATVVPAHPPLVARGGSPAP